MVNIKSEAKANWKALLKVDLGLLRQILWRRTKTFMVINKNTWWAHIPLGNVQFQKINITKTLL